MERRSVTQRDFANMPWDENSRTPGKRFDCCRNALCCDILPAEEVEQILPCVRTGRLESGEILFQAGDPPDALYIVARGKVDVLSATSSQHPSEHAMGEKLAELGEGQAFGEMALLSGEPRTATIQSVTQTDLLEIGKEDCGWPWCSRWCDRSKNIRWKRAR